MLQTGRIRKERLLTAICMGIVVAGIALRLAVYLQQRDLILDEVNLMRNLLERPCSGLLRPLSYEQFAPVPFLLISKGMVASFGAYEWAVRLYPLLCGTGALVAFYFLLRRMGVLGGAIYPLLLMASGMIYVRYATELKQYSADQLCSTLLLLLALRFNPRNTGPGRLLTIWCSTGFMATWWSMPAVFMMAGVGGAFLLQADRSAPTGRAAVASLIGAWMAVFLANYLLLLKPGIQSGYLQNWHKDYFLCLLPDRQDCWEQNARVIGGYFGALGEHWVLSFAVNALLAGTGVYTLLHRNKPLAVLLLVPVLCVWAASGLHQFTLLPRVCLFSYPVLLLLMGVGFEAILAMKSAKWIAPLFAVSGLITVINFNSFRNAFIPLQFEWITDDFKWLNRHHPHTSRFLIHELEWQPWQYYVHLHPDSQRWSRFKAADPFYWNTPPDSFARIHEPVAIVFNWIDAGELSRWQGVLRQYFRLQDSIVCEDRRIYYALPR